MRSYWIALAGAIVAEVIATSSMKASDGMTKLIPSALVIAGYLAAGYLLAYAMKQIDLSVAYAIWSGLGLVLTATIGVTVFGEGITLAKLFYTALILAGVIGLSLSKA